ncbi:MAG: hypothetical protein U1D69_08975 [Polynucleobacter sp.]|nr:hypothetical protein [Polynucleobacter sp.]
MNNLKLEPSIAASSRRVAVFPTLEPTAVEFSRYNYVGQRLSLPMNETLDGRAVHNFSEHKDLRGSGSKGQQQYQGEQNAVHG